MRLTHEMKLHDEAAFLTLTYRDAALPAGYTLRKRDVQLFMKRLRKARPAGLRFFACGEYGDTTFRPHYHVLLLNTHFPDMKFWKNSGKMKLYASAELDALWTHGDCLIGQVTPESAYYVAKYSVKKRTGKAAADYYKGREPEFSLMSRRPGIGAGYVEKYAHELLQHDNVVFKGKPTSMPRYYDNLLEPLNPKRLHVNKRARRRRAKLNAENNTSERLRVRESLEVQKKRTFGKRVLL